MNPVQCTTRVGLQNDAIQDSYSSSTSARGPCLFFLVFLLTVTMSAGSLSQSLSKLAKSCSVHWLEPKWPSKECLSYRIDIASTQPNACTKLVEKCEGYSHPPWPLLNKVLLWRRWTYQPKTSILPLRRNTVIMYQSVLRPSCKLLFPCPL